MNNEDPGLAKSFGMDRFTFTAAYNKEESIAIIAVTEDLVSLFMNNK